MNSKQKLTRLTKVQFYYQQTEERRKKCNIKNSKVQSLFNSPIKSQRVFNRSKLDFSSTKLGDQSCCCSDCGKESNFKQRIFKIYPFNGSQQFKQQKLLENLMKDRYRNAKYIHIFRKLVNCLIFIIRYKVVQNIRNRQRQRMKKALKTRIDKPRMTFLNVLDIATKKFHISPKFKSASNFEYVLTQNATAVNSPQDSDEEFYHLKPRQSIQQKFSSEEICPQKKLSKYQQKMYLITGPNSVLNNYVTEKLTKTPNKSKSQNTTCLPPLLSLTVSPRINQQSHFPNIRIKHF